MKKSFGLLALLALVLATSAAAQAPMSIGVYFDTAGTQCSKTVAGGPDEDPFDAYVIAFAEMVVGGAAFKLDKDPAIVVTGVAYPAGIQIGDILTGIEIGLTNPQIGYFGNPVRLATLTIWPGMQIIPYGRLNIVPWSPNYNAVILSDQNGVLSPAVGHCAWLNIPVPEQQTSWGDVKNLYQ